MIGMEMHFIFPFSGQMHLCDYGADISQCPKGTNCKGPGGTDFSYPRLYNFQAWSTRNFVHNALAALLPDQKDLIAQHADPGEYGLENYWIRALCIWFFVMSMMP